MPASVVISPALATYLTDGDFVDLGAIAHVYGHPPNQPTCFPYNNSRPSRRDYVFDSSSLLPLISNFSVGPQGDFGVHGCLHLQLTIPHEGLRKTVVTRPDMTMAERFDAAVQTICDQQQCARDSQAAKTIRYQAGQKLRESIANKLAHCGGTLHAHISRRDTSAAWGLWSRAVVECYAEGLPAEPKVPSCANTSANVDHRRTYAMYGRPTMKRAALFTPLRVLAKKLTLHPSITRSLHCLTRCYTAHEAATRPCWLISQLFG